MIKYIMNLIDIRVCCVDFDLFDALDSRLKRTTIIDLLVTDGMRVIITYNIT